MAITDWQSLASAKRTSNLSKIPPSWRLPSSLIPPESTQCQDPTVPPPTSPQSVLDITHKSGILTAHELELTEKYDATELVSLMTTGKATSVEVVTAFCKRAAVAHQLVNCLTEIMFEDALERAKECDEYYKREGKGSGSLHGLPISLKDSFNVKGHQTTLGYISFLSNPPATTDSYLVTVLHSHGAIFHCKTNLPQTMMSADSHNNVFGRTLNPHNIALTAGGSTGGEGALIAMRGSVLGMATDIAGSCRIPAVCCGVKSFKPSVGRVPFGGGVAVGRVGSPGAISPVIGPIGYSVRDFELTMRVACTEAWKYDENVIQVPWRKVESVKKPLKFGLLRGHAKRPLHPPIARALHSAATKFEEAGHKIVLLDDLIPDLWETAILAWKFFMLDPKKTPAKFVAAGGEPWVPSIPISNFAELKGWEPSLDELWDMNVERSTLLKKWHDIVVEHDLDAVLLPGYQATAVPHDTYGVAIYTVLQNILDYPSGILPHLKANKKLDEPFFKSDAAYEPAYKAEIVEGVPAHVQIMGKPMQDEELIEILKVVEGLLAE